MDYPDLSEDLLDCEAELDRTQAEVERLRGRLVAQETSDRIVFGFLASSGMVEDLRQHMALMRAEEG